jgi:hypothetical protein
MNRRKSLRQDTYPPKYVGSSMGSFARWGVQHPDGFMPK